MTPTTVLEEDALRLLFAEASPLPWYYDSYSRIRSLPRTASAERALEALPDDPTDEQIDACGDGVVADVPVARGDTATEQGRRDANLIESAVNTLPRLLVTIDELRRRIAQLERY